MKTRPKNHKIAFNYINTNCFGYFLRRYIYFVISLIKLTYLNNARLFCYLAKSKS